MWTSAKKRHTTAIPLLHASVHDLARSKGSRSSEISCPARLWECRLQRRVRRRARSKMVRCCDTHARERRNEQRLGMHRVCKVTIDICISFQKLVSISMISHSSCLLTNRKSKTIVFPPIYTHLSTNHKPHHPSPFVQLPHLLRPFLPPLFHLSLPLNALSPCPPCAPVRPKPLTPKRQRNLFSGVFHPRRIDLPAVRARIRGSEYPIRQLCYLIGRNILRRYIYPCLG